MISQMEARPPYITFEYREVEDRDASIDKGHYVTKSQAFVIVTVPGTRGETFEGIAEEWLARKRDEANNGNIPMEWFDSFQRKYEMWQKNEEIPESGIPIKTWPVLSPAERSIVLNANIRTVEDLAQCTEQGIATLGMGGRTLKDKAVNWLKAANDTGKAAMELSALKAELTDTKQLLQDAIATIQELKAQLPEEKRRGRPPKLEAA